MADGLVAGQAKAADDVARGPDETFLCGDVQEGSGVVGRLLESIEWGTAVATAPSRECGTYNWDRFELCFRQEMKWA
jgi:hypothetical protein